jgi:hypothetical protein
MSSYIDIPIVTDPDDLAGQAFDGLQARVPGWLPNDANFETIFIETLSLIASVVATKASGEPTSIFRWFGPLAGIQPIDASPATVASTWTARDDQGYSIPAGAVVGIRAAGDDLIPFAVLNPVDIPAGETATDDGAVTLVAVSPGAAGSGLGTIGGSVELIDPLDWVTSVVQTAVTTGGVDAEPDVDFQNRLRAELQLQSPRPILPPDFAALARTVAGVYRVVAIDGYNPGDDTFDNPRMVTVAAMDADGNAIGSVVKSAVGAYLEGLREVNFIVNVMDPTVTEIVVTFRVAVADGFDPSTVVSNAAAAVTSALSAKNWGVPPSGDPTAWSDSDTVRYLDLAHVILRTPGVLFIDLLALNEHTAAGTFTVTIASPAVFTLTAHGLSVGDEVILETTGSLPTGLAADVVYYVQAVVDADTFKLAATPGGSAIDTTGSQSGTHSLYRTGTADVTLSGPAALPHPYRVTGSHT